MGLLTVSELVRTPVQEPVLVFAIILFVFLAAPLLLDRTPLPSLVGLMIAGAVIGPNGLGLIERAGIVAVLGDLGLVYLLFLAALDIDQRTLRRTSTRGAVFGTLSFLIPQLVGTLVAIYWLGLTVGGALLFAAIFASHTLLAYPVVSRLGIAENEAISVTVGGTILTDVLALLVLAIVVAYATGTPGPDFWIILFGGLALLIVTVWRVVPWVAVWLFRRVDQGSGLDFLFVLVLLFLGAWAAELIGIKHIIGAFFVGVALGPVIPRTSVLKARIDFFGHTFLVPFFLLSVGMLADLSLLLEGPTTWILTTLLVGLVLVTKTIAGLVTGRWFAYSSSEVTGMIGLSLGQAAAALAIVTIGIEEGISGFDTDLLNAVVGLIVVTSVVSPILVDQAGRKLRTHTELQPDVSRTSGRRILVAVEPGDEAERAIFEVAMVLHGGRDPDPIVLVGVVPFERNPDQAVTNRERALSEAARYISDSGIDVETRVQVSTSVAAGIESTIYETHGRTVVLPWDGARSRRQHVIGSTIDHVIRRTDREVVVGRFEESIQSTTETVILLPREVVLGATFPETFDRLMDLGLSLPGSVTVVLLGDQREQLTSQLHDQQIPAGVSVTSFSTLEAVLAGGPPRHALLLAVSARRGTIGWTRKLERLPRRIANRHSGNFAIVYPRTHESMEPDGPFRF